MERHLDGEYPIISRGLSVYVGTERITFDEKLRWHNANGDHETLEEAVKEALIRYFGYDDPPSAKAKLAISNFYERGKST